MFECKRIDFDTTTEKPSTGLDKCVCLKGRIINLEKITCGVPQIISLGFFFLLILRNWATEIFC